MTSPPVGALDRTAAVIGITAVAFSALYFVSDLIELFQGGFSTLQLALTFAAEIAIPYFVLGLYVVQRPQIGRLGLVSSVIYAYTFTFFTSTVVYALVNHTSDWETLQEEFGAWLTIHSALMVAAGVTLGVAIARAKVLPRWTGITLIVGMVLMVATNGLPDATRTISAGVRDLAFAGMGASLLRNRHRQPGPIHDAPSTSSLVQDWTESALHDVNTRNAASCSILPGAASSSNRRSHNTTVLVETHRTTTTTTTEAVIEIELISLAPHHRIIRRSLADLRDLTRSIRDRGIETLLVENNVP